MFEPTKNIWKLKFQTEPQRTQNKAGLNEREEKSFDLGNYEMKMCTFQIQVTWTVSDC